MENSPLNKISAELRNQIYELVLMHEHPISITADDYVSDLRATNFKLKSHPLALLHTCKQISNESTALFYGNNAFHFEFPGRTADKDKDELCLVQRFCASIGDAALVGLRDLRVHATRMYDQWSSDIPDLPDLHSRNLLGLQGIFVMNDKLKTEYSLLVRSIGEDLTGDCGDMITLSLHVENLEETL